MLRHSDLKYQIQVTWHHIIVTLNHADTQWPYISDHISGNIKAYQISDYMKTISSKSNKFHVSGTVPPKSCIFGQFLKFLV